MKEPSRPIREGEELATPAYRAVKNSPFLIDDSDGPRPVDRRFEQVRRLEQHRMYKLAAAVRSCGKFGEIWRYECGRSFLRKIIRSNIRFCCTDCDRKIAATLFTEHRVYERRLDREGSLYRMTFQSGSHPTSRREVTGFENQIVRSVRRWLRGSRGWGFKSMTHVSSGEMLGEGIVYLPPGQSLPPGHPAELAIVGPKRATGDFKAVLAEILEPKLKQGHGVLRADLMSFFHRGKHLRNLGIFHGLIAKRRQQKRHWKAREKLKLAHLQPVQNKGCVDFASEVSLGCKVNTESRGEAPGVIPSAEPRATLPGQAGPATAPVPVETARYGPSVQPAAEEVSAETRTPPCPVCGMGCERLSSRIESLSKVGDIARYPTFAHEEALHETLLAEMAVLLE